jgi:hypothetical protein
LSFERLPSIDVLLLLLMSSSPAGPGILFSHRSWCPLLPAGPGVLPLVRSCLVIPERYLVLGVVDVLSLERLPCL